MKRTGLYIHCRVLSLVDSYGRHRGGISRNKAIEELTLAVLAPELLEIRDEVLQRAVEKAREEIEVTDGAW